MFGAPSVVDVIVFFGAAHPTLVFLYYVPWGAYHPRYVFLVHVGVHNTPLYDMLGCIPPQVFFLFNLNFFLEFLRIFLKFQYFSFIFF